MSNFINSGGHIVYTQTLSAPGNGAQITPDPYNGRQPNIFIGLTVTGDAIGKVQYSASDPSVVASGGGVWIDWNLGDVVSSQARYENIPRTMTGIRIVQAGGGTVTGTVSY